jgi:hypothetical protein
MVIWAINRLFHEPLLSSACVGAKIRDKSYLPLSIKKFPTKDSIEIADS